jgi:hypothetical protein
MRAKRVDDGYEAFLRAVRPTAISLQECTVSADRVKYREHIEGGQAVGTLSSEYTLAAATKEAFTVLARLTFQVAAGKRSPDSAPLQIAVAFEGQFVGSQEIPKRFAQRFATGEARLVFWPYFREFITSMTARIGITPLVMPFSTDAS